MSSVKLSIDLDWTERAACAGYSDAVFFPDSNMGSHLAKRICAGCPVSTNCLQVALQAEGTTTRHSRFGVFGGLTASERARLVEGATA